MDEFDQTQDHGHVRLGMEDIDHGLKPYWKRAHRDWRFWAGALFISAVIVMTWHW
jgi:hypothetical protein